MTTATGRSSVTQPVMTSSAPATRGRGLGRAQLDLGQQRVDLLHEEVAPGSRSRSGNHPRVPRQPRRSGHEGGPTRRTGVRTGSDLVLVPAPWDVAGPSGGHARRSSEHVPVRQVLQSVRPEQRRHPSAQWVQVGVGEEQADGPVQVEQDRGTPTCPSSIRHVSEWYSWDRLPTGGRAPRGSAPSHLVPPRPDLSHPTRLTRAVPGTRSGRPAPPPGAVGTPGAPRHPRSRPRPRPGA